MSRSTNGQATVQTETQAAPAPGVIEPQVAPTMFAEIEAMIGIDASRILIERMGGQQLQLGPRVEEALDDLIGKVATAKIYQEFGGGRICIPLKSTIETQAEIARRRKRIMEERRNGRTFREIATILGISERAVYYTLRD